MDITFEEFNGTDVGLLDTFYDQDFAVDEARLRHEAERFAKGEISTEFLEQDDRLAATRLDFPFEVLELDEVA